MAYKEKDFEAAIEAWLTTSGGWTKGDAPAYDRARALMPRDLLDFVQETQPKAWRRYAAAVGWEAERKFLDAFCQRLSRGGASILDVLRYGFSTRGAKFRVVGWQPETSLNPETQALYDANRLRCARQLHYSTHNENSLDMVLFVNGLPLVTLELKNQLTGQSVDEGKYQYMHDRDPGELIFQFRKRALVHFTVDLYECWMTTRLAGKDTLFLPFNQGSNGAGRVGGAGNPVNPNGFATDYLWKNVLRRDALLETFHKYMLYEKAKDRMIFPRYHQLDVVTKLLADVRAHGAGRNYLIEHSAGSGKSNSIAWLAYRLASLHDAHDEKIFQSIIVVTDRRVLDSQLQDTIYQFNHVPGVVERITKNAKQLRDAINGGKKIIITTLQKFPVIFDEVQANGARFAILVDEAHSSQTGESAQKLKRALGDREAILEAYARMEAEDEDARLDDEDRMLAQLDELASHGQQPNLSFFAFTATPKNKTLQIFGQQDASGKYVPFHIYSMRQAIEEHFILDVLKNYVTYHMYYKIIQRTPENPELDSARGLAAIKRFEALHPHNIAQKTEIIMEHFLRITRHKIGGKAKAMIVTASRLHAVRYFQAIQSYLRQHHLENDVGVLVAFSGDVEDEDTTYTEPGLNVLQDGEHVSERALPETFHGDDFHVLVVAEKYQTGFDEPLLHTMFVDKKLDGVKAVQTLSRLNRVYPGKEDTFILDFVNTAEDIQNAFADFYEGTILSEGADPDIIYDMKQTLDGMGVYGNEDVAAVAKLFYTKMGEGADMGRLSGLLKPCLDRFAALPNEDQGRFKSVLHRFNSAYAFITQIARMFDREMQSFSVFANFLSRALPKEHHGKLDLEDALGLEYYRLKKDFDGTITLAEGGGELRPMTGSDGTTTENKKAPLKELIDRINEANGTNFTSMDKVLTQIIDDFQDDAKAVNFAKANDEKMFYRDYYQEKFEDILFARFAQNQSFMEFLAKNENAMQELMQGMVHQVYEGLRRKA